MVTADTKAVIERAKRIYADQLQAILDAHRTGPQLKPGTSVGKHETDSTREHGDAESETSTGSAS